MSSFRKNIIPLFSRIPEIGNPGAFLVQLTWISPVMLNLKETSGNELALRCCKILNKRIYNIIISTEGVDFNAKY